MVETKTGLAGTKAGHDEVVSHGPAVLLLDHIMDRRRLQLAGQAEAVGQTFPRPCAMAPASATRTQRAENIAISTAN